MNYVSMENTNSNVKIGLRATPNTQPLNGSISTTQIYNKALTQSEITEIYTAGKDSYTPVGDGLIAQYSGKDFEGTTANPTTIYDTNQLVDGKINEGFTFDGVDDYVDTGDINITSVSYWIKSLKSSRTDIFRKTDAGIIGIQGGHFALFDGSSWLETTANVNIGTWQFVVASYNGTGYDFYIDNVAYENLISDKIIFDRISRDDSVGVYGSLDDVRIFNRSLTADEISSLYNDGAGTEETVNGVITLNSPTDNAIAYNNPVTFSASAEVSGGATLTNMTLYNNISGSWEANGTETLNNLIISDNQEMCGTYTGYANIIINNTAIITICDYNGTSGTGELTLHAYNDVTIESGVTINGAGKGYTGGAAPTNTNGNNGNGDGNGLGGYYDTIGTNYAGGGSGAGGYAIGGYGGGSPDVPSSNRKAGGIAIKLLE